MMFFVLGAIERWDEMEWDGWMDGSGSKWSLLVKERC